MAHLSEQILTNVNGSLQQVHHANGVRLGQDVFVDEVFARDEHLNGRFELLWSGVSSVVGCARLRWGAARITWAAGRIGNGGSCRSSSTWRRCGIWGSGHCPGPKLTPVRVKPYRLLHYYTAEQLSAQPELFGRQELCIDRYQQ